MSFFYVDDGLAFHRKAVEAGNAALGLWVRAGSWSMQQLTDGHIPTSIARQLGTPREAAALVRVGLWLEVDDGYRFHEFIGPGRQMSREQVLARREAKARAGAAGGRASGESRRAKVVDLEERRGS